MSPAPPPRPWWLRGYGLALVFLVFGLLAALVAGRVLGFYNHYYIPAEAMEPTLMKGDRLVAWLDGGADLRRGDVVILRMSGAEYVKRVAGLPGDTIELVAGQVFLNGRRVDQRPIGIARSEGPYGPVTVRRFAEQFPGEAQPHHIQDSGLSTGDDFALFEVPPGHVFLLGDNRDHSADSRFPPDVMGVGPLPVERVRGKVRFHGFGSSRRFGAPIGP